VGAVTLLPSEDFGVRGHPGKPYDVNDICAAPGCGTKTAHCHHLWPRSFLRSQPYEWVELPDGTVIGNRIGLCFSHHEQVTGGPGGHRARISFRAGLFWWTPMPEEDLGWTGLGPIDPQPPGVPTHVEAPPADDASTNGACPTCGHVKHRVKQPRRKSKTWTIDVPDDAEVGSEILDDWVDEIAFVLGLDDERSRLRRYHALVVTLAWAMQSKEQFLREIRTASERIRAEAP